MMAAARDPERRVYDFLMRHFGGHISRYYPAVTVVFEARPDQTVHVTDWEAAMPSGMAPNVLSSRRFRSHDMGELLRATHEHRTVWVPLMKRLDAMFGLGTSFRSGNTQHH